MSDQFPRLGLSLPVTGGGADAETMIEIARRAEQLGYASLWTFQRLLSPVSVDRAFDAAHNPGARPIDDTRYRSVDDPVVPLALVAGHTSAIRLGTATICAPFTPPVVLAKTLATLDRLSGGRLDVGLGMGWLPEEFAAAGVPYAGRGARLEEYLRCLEALWADDPVTFDGDLYTVPRSYVGPKPRQRPRPPLLLGGGAPAALRRAGRLADGWICAGGQDLDILGAGVALVHEGATAAGRDPSTVRILVRTPITLHDRGHGLHRAPLQGTPEQIADDLQDLAGQGATEVILDPAERQVDGSETTRLLEALSPYAIRRERATGLSDSGP